MTKAKNLSGKKTTAKQDGARGINKGLKVSMIIFGVLSILTIIISLVLIGILNSSYNYIEGDLGDLNDRNQDVMIDQFAKGQRVFNYILWEDDVLFSSIVSFVPAMIMTIIFSALSITCWVKVRSKMTLINMIISIVVVVLIILLFIVGSTTNAIFGFTMTAEGTVNLGIWNPNKETLETFSQNHSTEASNIKSQIESAQITKDANIIDFMLMGILPIIAIVQIVFLVFAAISAKTIVRDNPYSAGNIKKQKITIIILSAVGLLFVIIGLGLFGSSNWTSKIAETNIIHVSSSYFHYYGLASEVSTMEKSISAAAFFGIAIILLSISLDKIIKIFKHGTRTKLLVFGIAIHLMGIVAILFPLFIVSVQGAIYGDLEWFSDQVSKIYNNNVQLYDISNTDWLQSVSRVYTYGIIIGSLFIIALFTFIVLAFIEMTGKTKLSKEMKYGGLLPEGTSEYKKSLYGIFRLSMLLWIISFSLLFIIIFVPIWFSFAPIIDEIRIALIAYIVIIMMAGGITLLVISIKAIIKAFKLEKQQGYNEGKHGSDVSVVKITSIVNFGGVLLPIFTIKAISNEGGAVVVATTAPAKATPVKTSKEKPVEDKNLTSLEARLDKLKKLKEKGVISEEEYNAKRKQVIDESI